jgi:hypothetical protein
MSMNKKITKQIKNMPKYSIQEEAYANQNLARSRAFGRNRDTQMQEENIAKEGANAIAEAKSVSGSTSGILGTISAIQASKNSALRDLAVAETQNRNQSMGELYNANQAMIDEKDKAWYQNVYAPWDAKLRDLQRKKANRDRILADVGNGLMGALQSFVGGGMGGMGGGGGGKAKGTGVTDFSIYNYGSGTSIGNSPSMEQDNYGSSSRYS